jgi:transposase
VIGEVDGLGVYNPSLIDLPRHFGFHLKACRQHRAHTKGEVERPSRDIRQDFYFAGNFGDPDELSSVAPLARHGGRSARTHATTKRVSTKRWTKSGRRCARYHWRPAAQCSKLERRV